MKSKRSTSPKMTSFSCVPLDVGAIRSFFRSFGIDCKKHTICERMMLTFISNSWNLLDQNFMDHLRLDEGLC